jgi:hypothetical protein
MSTKEPRKHPANRRYTNAEKEQALRLGFASSKENWGLTRAPWAEWPASSATGWSRCAP